MGSLISTPYSRAELKASWGLEGVELRERIRDLKRTGQLMQKRIPVSPLSTKKRVVFYLMATTGNLF